MNLARFFRTTLLTAPLLFLAAGASAEPVTYAEHVAPILKANCQDCHHPGEAVPMSLLSYEEVRPWAKSIAKVVESRTMPPWHAHASIGEWENERSLTDEQIDTLVAWANQGAPAGDLSKAPAPIEFIEGWKLGEPEMIFEMPEERVLGEDLVDEYLYESIPTGLTEDRWLSAVEVRPGNMDVVHHVIVFVRGANSDQRGGLQSGLGGYAPGLQPYSMPDGMAMFLPANSTLILQMHYNKEQGVTATDRTRIGVKFAKAPVKKRLYTHFVGDRSFVIPPGAENHEVIAKDVLLEDITIRSVTPHMHLRGTDMKVWANFPSGEKKDVVWVPEYDFNWQTSYKFAEPLKAPAGTELVAVAHYDNSANNPFNPDPTAEVRWGLPTYAEMMFAFYSFTKDNEELNELDPSAKGTVAEPAGGSEAEPTEQAKADSTAKKVADATD